MPLSKAVVIDDDLLSEWEKEASAQGAGRSTAIMFILINEVRRLRGKNRLPETRPGDTFHFVIHATKECPTCHGPGCDGCRSTGRVSEDFDGYLSTGLYPDGKVGEIFVKVGRDSNVHAMLDEWAKAFSYALQHRADFVQLCRKFAHTQFEPAGPTNCPDVPRCSSPIDFICRWLLRKYSREVEL